MSRLAGPIRMEILSLRAKSVFHVLRYMYDPEKSRLRKKPPNIGQIVKEIALLTLDKKAEDVIILDLRKISDATDYFIMVSGYTDTQVKAIADYIIDEVKDREVFKPWHIEGYRHGTWILLDYIDFVVHIFEKETREYYRLERLWGDAEKIELKDEA